MRDHRLRNPAAAEPGGAHPRRRGKEKRVGAALDQPGLQGRGEVAVGQRRQVLRRRRDHAGGLLLDSASFQREEVSCRSETFPDNFEDRQGTGEPPGFQGGAPQQPARLSPRSCQVTCFYCSTEVQIVSGGAPLPDLKRGFYANWRNNVRKLIYCFVKWVC